MATFTGDGEVSQEYLDAINRGSAIPIGSGALNGHLVNCEPGQMAANFNEPGSHWGADSHATYPDSEDGAENG
jgi:hypothetical protein